MNACLVQSDQCVSIYYALHVHIFCTTYPSILHNTKDPPHSGSTGRNIRRQLHLSSWWRCHHDAADAWHDDAGASSSSSLPGIVPLPSITETATFLAPTSVPGCDETRVWKELIALTELGRMRTGDLGHLMIDNEMEVWLCVQKGECLGDIYSLAINVTNPDRYKLPEWALTYKLQTTDSMTKLHRFLPWAPNSILKLYPNPSSDFVLTDQGLHQSRRHLPQGHVTHAHLTYGNTGNTPRSIPRNNHHKRGGWNPQTPRVSPPGTTRTRRYPRRGLATHAGDHPTLTPTDPTSLALDPESHADFTLRHPPEVIISKRVAILELTRAMDSSDDWEARKDAEKRARYAPVLDFFNSIPEKQGWTLLQFNFTVGVRGSISNLDRTEPLSFLSTLLSLGIT
jgi:hypothetical protein